MSLMKLTIMVSFLVQMVSMAAVTAATTSNVNCSPTNTSSMRIDILGEATNGIDLMLEVGRKTLLGGQVPQRPEFDLGQKTVCTMYNFYLHFTTSLTTLRPDSALYGNYTSNQLLAWSVMQAACQWVQVDANCTSGVLKTCSLEDIADMCYSFQLRNLLNLSFSIDDYIADNRLHNHISGSNALWLDANLLPISQQARSAGDVILDATGCCLSTDGTGYVC